MKIYIVMRNHDLIGVFTSDSLLLRTEIEKFTSDLVGEKLICTTYATHEFLLRHAEYIRSETGSNDTYAVTCMESAAHCN